MRMKQQQAYAAQSEYIDDEYYDEEEECEAETIEVKHEGHEASTSPVLDHKEPLGP